MKVLIILSLLSLILISQSTILDDIAKLRTDLYASYWKEDTRYKQFKKWDHIKGLFPSDIHFNFVDKKNSARTAYMRQKMKIDDENMFVTSFVLYGLIEAEQLQTLKIDHHYFSQSLETIGNFRDKNQQFGVPQYMFWPQQKINGTWSSNSVNLFDLIDSIPNLPKYLQNFLSNHGLGLWIFAKQIKSQFCIPADTDDSSVNIALLGLLHEANSQHYQFWKNSNFKMQKFYDQISKYAYRPFDLSGKYPRSGQIDPRTYFIIHDFLKMKKDQAVALGKQPSVILPTTWIMNFDQQIIDVVVMPFYLNNVDASVNANFLFGLLYQIKSKNVVLNEELRQMMRDISDLLVYAIDKAVDKRPDLILMYYPSKYDFYWFVARIVCLLQRMEDQRKDTDVAYVYNKLENIMRTKGTEHILRDKKTNANTKSSYWVQFLGNFGKKNRNQDAVYSTALVLNTLLDTWGVKKSKSFKLIGQTPQNVKLAITQGVAFLQTALQNKKIKLGNAFFSGSLKILLKDYPAIFPANVILDGHNKAIDAQKYTLDELDKQHIQLVQDCVKGYIQDEDYQKKLKLKWFGVDVPVNFDGYNDGKGMLFPFWSSKSITQIMMITALSKYYHVSSQANLNLQIDV